MAVLPPNARYRAVGVYDFLGAAVVGGCDPAVEILGCHLDAVTPSSLKTKVGRQGGEAKVINRCRGVSLFRGLF